MKKQLNRRMFLKGSGGALLAIPFLPSLTTRAFAQEGPRPLWVVTFWRFAQTTVMSGAPISTPAMRGSQRRSTTQAVRHVLPDCRCRLAPMVV